VPRAPDHRFVGSPRGERGRGLRDWPVRMTPASSLIEGTADPIDYHFMGMVVRPERSPSPPERDRVENSLSDRD
jgi:hypothetical protein